MRCPTLKELPPPPPGKTGWPWTEESPRVPDTMPDGRPWPKISIITPSYNQGSFLEETIRSVLLQGYPNLEYIIIDGGSTDSSVEIIKKYEPWLAYWVSEPDRGQAHAINKGFRRATGEILAWLNSDDMYFPGALKAVAEASAHNPQGILFYGDCTEIDKDNRPIHTKRLTRFDLKILLSGRNMAQPAVFWKKDVLVQVGYLNEGLHYALDFEFFLRVWFQYSCVQSKRNTMPFVYVPQVLAFSRLWGNTKTTLKADSFGKEYKAVLDNFFSQDLPEDLRKLKRKAYARCVYWRQARLLWQQGRFREARRHLMRALVISPDWEDKRRTLKYLLLTVVRKNSLERLSRR